MGGPHHGQMPGMGSAMPPGMGMPPGMPSGLALPPGVTLPKNAAEMLKQLQERAKAAGMKPQQ